LTLTTAKRENNLKRRKKVGLPDIELERSMNLQSRVMTIEETLRNSTVIDSVDDKRRKKMHGVLKWARDIHKSIVKDLKKLEVENKGATPQDVERLLEKMFSFAEKFENSITKLISDEEVLEQLDDKNREFLIEYTKTTREKLKKDNSFFEKSSIEMRLIK
jgi:hypothetical protein